MKNFKKRGKIAKINTDKITKKNSNKNKFRKIDIKIIKKMDKDKYQGIDKKAEQR